MMGGILTITLLANLLCPRPWIKCWIPLTAAGLITLTIEWLKDYTAARRMALDRREQTFELLLTTPISIQDLIQGEQAALHRMFLPLYATSFVVSVGLMLSSLPLVNWTPDKAISFSLAWLIVLTANLRRLWLRNYRGAIRAMWAGLNTGSPALAVSKAWGLGNMGLYSFVVISLLSSLFSFPSGRWIEILDVSFLVILFFHFAFFHHAKDGRSWSETIEDYMIEDLIYVVAEPLPDTSDMRIKRWNVLQRLYYHRPTLLRPLLMRTAKRSS
jgi:hypothetical protein